MFFYILFGFPAINSLHPIFKKNLEIFVMREFVDITNLSSKRVKVTVHKSVHRKKLLRWIYEVCKDFLYNQYTYTLTVLIIDSFTEANSFSLDEYQLIGISSLLIGAKIEEKKTRLIEEYAFVTDNAFTTKEILDKEIYILKILNFKLPLVYPQTYLDIDHLNRTFKDSSIEASVEILNSFIAAQLEISTYTKNMKLVYLESLREMETQISTRTFSELHMFYISNNSNIKDNLIFCK